MIMNDVDFVHLRAGKCTLNGKRINVRMNDVGKLQVGDWQLEDFIKVYFFVLFCLLISPPPLPSPLLFFTFLFFFILYFILF